MEQCQSEECKKMATMSYYILICTSTISLVVLWSVFIMFLKKKHIQRITHKIFINIIFSYILSSIIFFIDSVNYFSHKNKTNFNVLDFTGKSLGFINDECQTEGYLSYFTSLFQTTWRIFWIVDLYYSFIKRQEDIAKTRFYTFNFLGYAFPILVTFILVFISLITKDHLTGPSIDYGCYLNMDKLGLYYGNEIFSLIYLGLGFTILFIIFKSGSYKLPIFKDLNLDVYFYLQGIYFVWSIFVHIMFLIFGNLKNRPALNLAATVIISIEPIILMPYFAGIIYIAWKNQKFLKQYDAHLKAIAKQADHESLLIREKKQFMAKCLAHGLKHLKDGVVPDRNAIPTETMIERQYEFKMFSHESGSEIEILFTEIAPNVFHEIRVIEGISFHRIKRMFKKFSLRIDFDAQLKILSQEGKHFLKSISLINEVPSLQKMLPSLSEYYFRIHDFLSPILGCFIIEIKSENPKKLAFILQKNYPQGSNLWSTYLIKEKQPLSDSFISRSRFPFQEKKDYYYCWKDFRTFHKQLKLDTHCKERVMNLMTEDINFLCNQNLASCKIKVHLKIQQIQKITEMIGLNPQEEFDESMHHILDYTTHDFPEALIKDFNYKGQKIKKIITKQKNKNVHYFIHNKKDIDRINSLQKSELIHTRFDSFSSVDTRDDILESYTSVASLSEADLEEGLIRSKTSISSSEENEKESFESKKKNKDLLDSMLSSTSSEIYIINFPRVKIINSSDISFEINGSQYFRRSFIKKRRTNKAVIQPNKDKEGYIGIKDNEFRQLLLNFHHGGIFKRKIVFEIWDYLKGLNIHEKYNFPVIDTKSYADQLLKKIKTIL